MGVPSFHHQLVKAAVELSFADAKVRCVTIRLVRVQSYGTVVRLKYVLCEFSTYYVISTVRSKFGLKYRTLRGEFAGVQWFCLR